MSDNKKLTVFGCLLLVAAFVMPGVVAHDDYGRHEGYATLGQQIDAVSFSANNAPGDFGGRLYVGPHVDECAGNPEGSTGPCDGDPFVSGWYMGPAGPFVGASIHNGTDPGGRTLTFLGGGNALCDLEAMVGGTTAEEYVDGTHNMDGTPDGVWNDGGFGAACHVDYGDLLPESYSTFGCGPENAIAEDAVFGVEVWISASCDWQHTAPHTTTETLIDILLSDTIDCINSFLVLGPDPACADDSIDCLVSNEPTCVTNEVQCLTGNLVIGLDPCPFIGPPIPDAVCGADGITDGSNFGEGDGHLDVDQDEEENTFAVDPWNAGGDPGVPFPTVTNNCDEFAIAAVFTFASAFVTADLVGDVDSENTVGDDGNGQDDQYLIDVNAAVPTHGWISGYTPEDAGTASVDGPMDIVNLNGIIP